ncbi:MAG: hypothetical protein NXI10_01605 [bacterium]|nr:hypothetical protein [bacterium]
MKTKNQTIRNIALAALLFLSFQTSAQTITYNILEDNPETVRNKFVAVEFLNADIGGNRNLNTVGIGANAAWGLTEKLGVEGRIGYALFKDENLPACFSIQAGPYLGLISRKSTKDVKVRIGGEFDTEENKHVYKESFIYVPATRLNQHGVRGGVYFNKKGYKEQAINGKPEIPYSLFGVYGGWSMTQKTNLIAKILGSSDGENVPEMPLEYTGFTRIYVDALITPVATRNYPVGDINELSSVSNKMFGGRVGCMFYKDGKKWFNKFMWGVEVGMRPIDGFYFSTTVGYSVFRGK